MHADPKRRGGSDSKRVPVTIALSLAVAAMSAGLVLGHHRPAGGTASEAAAPASMAPAGQLGATADRSVPAASDVVGGATNDATSPAATF